MHQQTETVKRFHSKPQWQQILAACTFLGKNWTKKVDRGKNINLPSKMKLLFHAEPGFNWLEPLQSVKIWFVLFRVQMTRWNEFLMTRGHKQVISVSNGRLAYNSPGFQASLWPCGTTYGIKDHGRLWRDPFHLLWFMNREGKVSSEWISMLSQALPGKMLNIPWVRQR